MHNVAIYARVSAYEQDPDMQLMALRDYANKRDFHSCSKKTLPEINAAFELSSRRKNRIGYLEGPQRITS